MVILRLFCKIARIVLLYQKYQENPEFLDHNPALMLLKVRPFLTLVSVQTFVHNHKQAFLIPLDSLDPLESNSFYSTLPDHTVQTKIEKAYSAKLVEKKLFVKISISAVSKIVLIHCCIFLHSISLVIGRV